MGNTGYDHGTLTQNKLPSGGQETNNNMVAMAGGHHGYDRGYPATSTATTYPDLQTGECKFSSLLSKIVLPGKLVGTRAFPKSPHFQWKALFVRGSCSSVLENGRIQNCKPLSIAQIFLKSVFKGPQSSFSIIK